MQGDGIRERPIIFSAPMICALLGGRKTMTRRLAWREFPQLARVVDGRPRRAASPWQRVQPGDRLWVRESFAHAAESPRETLVVYRSTTEPDGGFDYIHKDGCIERLRVRRWHPSIDMPRSYSRLTLTVTATKIERLAAISDADARAEGVADKAAFFDLWWTLHKPGDGANPEVVALTFVVDKRNIDAGMKGAA